jgi:hypothetical protein
MSRVVKKTVQFPREQPGDVQDLLKSLRDIKIDDAAYMSTYFQILAKDPGWMNRIQPPKAYVPPLLVRQPAPQHVPQAQPPPMPRPCAFCNASNCLGQGPRECPIGQDCIRSERVTFNEGCYRWPNGVRVQGHPKGLKVSVDLALWSEAPSQNVSKGTAAFYRVDPVDYAVDGEEERGEVIREGVEGVEEPREAYPAIVSVAAEAAKSHPALNKKSPQYHYSSKCDAFLNQSMPATGNDSEAYNPERPPPPVNPTRVPTRSPENSLTRSRIRQQQFRFRFQKSEFNSRTSSQPSRFRIELQLEQPEDDS